MRSLLAMIFFLLVLAAPSLAHPGGHGPGEMRTWTNAADEIGRAHV